MGDGHRPPGDATSSSADAVPLDCLAHPYQSLDEDGTVLAVNEAWLALLGYEREDAEGERFGEFLAAASADRFEARIPDPAADGRVTDLELEVRHADGHSIVVALDGRPEYDDGQFVRTHCQLREITGRKRRRRELDRYEAIVEGSTDVATVVDADGVITYVSPSVRRVLGYEPEELLGENGFDYQPPGDRETVADAIESLRDDPGGTRTVAVRFRRADGSWARIESSMRNFLDHEVIDGILVHSRDVTERMEREREFRRLSREYETLLENATDAIFLLDVDETGTDVEFRFEQLGRAHEVKTGLRTADVRGERPRDVFGEDQAAAVAANYRRCVETREPITYEETLSVPEGEFVWQTSLAPVVVDGEVTRIVGIARDVTERTEYERRLEEQRDSLDVLNQVLRHDVRNDLQLVTAYAELLVDHVDEEGRAHLETLAESAEHAVELTATARDMADVMLTTADDRHGVALRSVLEDVLDEIRSTRPEAVVTVEGSIPRETVLANEMLDSVFRNVLKNAIQHNDEDVPAVTVSATARREGEGEGQGDAVVVRVADNGPGVPDGQKASIFGKGEKGLESAGTGIGLYLVRTLVDTYGGDVRVEDNDPEGAVFVVELPTAE